ncbi:hypothetical protein IIU_06711 [Bacillus cereus VD133]|uniref:Uncharacterized protein n=1 Tax=Bacillus cereus VD133 TaxID=1053233 RepID=A0A9W5PJR4_BACCE|nr:hypothetical protein [Bacillus cereus]EOO24489.1 hypothetical protein IIU_06711 [Bacillus cereus VD133]
MFKKKNNFKKIGAIVLSTTILAGGILPVTSHAQETTNSNDIVEQFTQSDVDLINSNAEDTEVEGREKRSVVNSSATKSRLNSLNKSLAVIALRTAADDVQSALARVIGENNAVKASKNFNKLADYIERAQVVEKDALANILIESGLTSDKAGETARWIVSLFGLLDDGISSVTLIPQEQATCQRGKLQVKYANGTCGNLSIRFIRMFE